MKADEAKPKTLLVVGGRTEPMPGAPLNTPPRQAADIAAICAAPRRAGTRAVVDNTGRHRRVFHDQAILGNAICIGKRRLCGRLGLALSSAVAVAQHPGCAL